MHTFDYQPGDGSLAQQAEKQMAAQLPQYAAIGGVFGQDSAKQVRKATPAEMVRDNAERAVARLSQLRAEILSLRERICGSVPQSAEQAGDTLNASGFINGTGSAVERIHIEINAISEVLTSIAQVV